MGDVDGPLTGVKDAEIDRLLDDYRRVNNDEDLTAAEQEEALAEIASGIRERQAKLMEECEKKRIWEAVKERKIICKFLIEL